MFIVDAPKCSNVQYIYGVGVNETVDIECRVDANPPVVYFRWLVNETLNTRLMHSNSYLESRLHFIATNRHQFGNVECHAQNSIGQMETPCVYKIIPYNPPDVPHVCSVITLPNVNHTSHHNISIPERSNTSEPGFMVRCEYDWDGGLDTICTMSIFRSNDSLVVWNGTNIKQLKVSNGSHACFFYIHEVDLDPEIEYRFTVITANRAGQARGKAYEHLLSHSILTARKDGIFGRFMLTASKLDSLDEEPLVENNNENDNNDSTQQWANTNQVIIIVVIIGIFSVVVFGLVYTVISVFVLYNMDAKLREAQTTDTCLNSTDAIPLKSMTMHGLDCQAGACGAHSRMQIHVNQLDPYNQLNKQDMDSENEDEDNIYGVECFNPDMTLEQCQHIIDANFTPVPLNLMKEFEEAEGFADVAELIPEIFFKNAGEFV